MSHETGPTDGIDDVEHENLREMIREEIRTAKERGDVSRRDLMKAGGLAGLTALIGGGGLAASTGTAAAASGDQEEARAYLSTDTSVASSSGMQVALDAESFDPNGNFDTSTGEYTAPSAGKYLVQWNPSLIEPNDGTKFVAQIQVNGGGYEAEQMHTAGAADYLSAHVVDLLNLSSGDTVAFRVFHNSPESETLSGAAKHTYTTIHKLTGGSGSSDHVNPDHEPTDTYYNINASRPMISMEHKTYYVSADGSDSNGGESSSDPLATLEEVGNRLPYMLFHGLKVVIMTNTSGPATADSGGTYWPPMWVNFTGNDSDIDIVAEGTDPENHLIDTRGLSFSVRGQEPSGFKFKNLKFHCRPQNYNGIVTFENCILHGFQDSDFNLTSAIGGYAGKNYFDQCTFGGNVEHLSKYNQGHEFFLFDCDGDVDNALAPASGFTMPKLFIQDGSGGNELSFPSYVSSSSDCALVIHNGTLKHPSV